MRFIWATLGLVCIALALIGVVLPLLPTVPFLLLAAFFFARSSERLHNWLLSHPKLGPPIEDWQTRGAINPGAKRIATLSIVVVFGISLAIGLKTSLLLIQAVVLGCVLLFIWTRPNW
ncbi:YbaN family protein [Shimia sediminis]|uniref:YbaN family protein n=1 Tax=Shimia sediminis TaxID=2497945 RepID=UPI000F8E8672|nr:YbaN family protein [Shimia sediminis]